MQGTSTYLYIACASGFKSRTVFFEQLKEKTSYTPQEYIVQKQKEAEKKKKKSLLETLDVFTDMLKAPDENKDFIAQYEVNPDDYVKNEQQEQQEPQKEAEAVQQVSGEQPDNEQPAQPLGIENRVDWEQLARLGITRESLEQSGDLSAVLSGGKSGLITISTEIEGIPITTQGRIHYQEGKDGKMELKIDCYRRAPALDLPFYGVVLDKEIKDSILATDNAGRPLPLWLDGSEPKPCLISLDKLTNNLVALPVDDILIPMEIKNVALTPEQHCQLSEGKRVLVEGMTSARERKDGYMEGNGYAVTWGFGHLVGLVMPEAYDFTGFRREHLPILPESFRLVPRQVKDGKQYTDDPGAVKQLAVIRELFNQSESIICATDAGREGELIFRYIYHYLGCGKPFSRLWISSLTDKAIRQGMESLKDGREYDNLYRSAKARSEADWLVGINASQALCLSAGRGVYSLGRVQTPTLMMIYFKGHPHPPGSSPRNMEKRRPAPATQVRPRRPRPQNPALPETHQAERR